MSVEKRSERFETTTPNGTLTVQRTLVALPPRELPDIDFDQVEADSPAADYLRAVRPILRAGVPGMAGEEREIYEISLRVANERGPLGAEQTLLLPGALLDDLIRTVQAMRAASSPGHAMPPRAW